jgi:hypothetical protein
VRVGYYRRRDGSYGPRHTKFFGDATYGGKRKAQRVAEAFVAKVLRADAKRKRSARARRRAKRDAYLRVRRRKSP